MIRNADDQIHGIELTWVSDEACVGGATNSTNSFTAKVLCDKTNNVDGEAEILAVDASNKCNPIVTLQHDSGCPEFDDSGRSMRLMRLAVPILAILLVIGLCGFMCCCYCRSRKERQARKEQELKQGSNSHSPIQAQHDANNIQ